MNKNWYAVLTRPACEKKVVAQLAKRNWDCYLPFNCIFRREENREEQLYVPLFPSCVFVQASEPDLVQIKKIEHVISLLYWLNKPAVIKSEEMEQMQQFLYEHKHVTAARIAVNTEQSPNLSQDIMRIDERGIKRRTIRLILPSLGYTLAAAVEPVKVKAPDPGVYNLLHVRQVNSLN